MKRKKQNLQQKNFNLMAFIFTCIKSFSIKTKIKIVSFITLILGSFFINRFNNNELLKNLEESKRRTEEKLKLILMYEDELDKNKISIKKIEKKIDKTKLKIEEITKEESESTSIDDFFDKRV